LCGARMNITILKFCFLMVLIAVLTSCGPTYRTTYEFIPPESAAGMQCLTNCQLIVQQCESNLRLEQQNCETQAALEYQLCMASRVMGPDPKRGWRSPKCLQNCYCSRRYCSMSSTEVCQVRFRECYSQCGGKVIGTTVCVSNCEDDQQPPG